MLTFNQYILTENALTGKPVFQPVSRNRCLEILFSECRDALPLLKKKFFIYRGEVSDVRPLLLKYGHVTVDTSASQRVSKNNANYYTLIMDNISGREKFPKRGRSFICTHDRSLADNFNEFIYVIIPYDGVKIGVCSGSDIWNTQFNKAPFGISTNLNGGFLLRTLNKIYNYCDLSDVEWNSFVTFDKKLKSGDSKAIDSLGMGVAMVKNGINMDDYRLKTLYPDPDAEKYAKIFLQELTEAYSPQNMGQYAYTTKTLPHNLGDKELWVGGKCLCLSLDAARDIAEGL